MKAASSFLWHLCSCFGVLLQLLRYAFSLCWALLLPRAVTAAQLVAVQSQLAAELNHSAARRKRHGPFSPAFRMLWVVLSKFLNGWEVAPRGVRCESPNALVTQGAAMPPHRLRPTWQAADKEGEAV
jgi:hypothetical protein